MKPWPKVRLGEVLTHYSDSSASTKRLQLRRVKVFMRLPKCT